MAADTITSLDFAGGAITPPVPLRESSFVDDFSRGGWGFGLGPLGYNQMPWWAASGTGNDRKGGRDLPLFWNEIDLRGFRLVARDLESRNQFAIGFLNLLTAYHVHKGFGWQACLKGTKKAAYPTAAANDPLVAKAQRILDSWRDANRWPLRSREAFRRWRRDGEVFGRLSFSGWDRLPVYRPIDPELISSPTGDTDGPDSFGIRVDPDDVEEVVAYHVLNPNDPTEGKWEDAGRVVHIKANVDSNVKRGVTDFLPVAEQFDGCRRLLRNMLTSTVRQAGTAWMERIPGATLEQARGIVPQVVGRPAPYGPNPQDPWQGYRGYGYDPPEPPGSVKKVEGDREFMPTPAGAAPSYIAALQASLRGCCVRWGMPEFATGDASNNNFASALVANGPFTRMVEGTQFEWGACWERPIAIKVLELACEAGYLTRQELAQLDIEVTEPQVASAEPEKDATINSTLNQAKVMSATTWQLKLGLDPQHEAANFAEEAKRDQQSQQQPAPAPAPTDGGGGMFESIVLRENFTGTITDAAGHERHYVNGKQVVADNGGGVPNAAAKAKPTKPTFPHPKWSKDNPEINGTISAFDAAEGKEKEFISNAMENAGLLRLDPSGERVVGYERQIDDDAPERLAQGLAAAFRDAHPLGTTQHITAALQALGAEQIGGNGEATSFDGAVHDHVPGAFTGHDVKVTRPGWLLGNRVLLKATIAKNKTESILRENFTGTDANGHHWVNGKQVAKQDDGDGEKPQGKAEPAPARDKDAPWVPVPKGGKATTQTGERGRVEATVTAPGFRASYVLIPPRKKGDSPVLLLDDMRVHPSMQGQGLGRSQFLELVKSAREMGVKEIVTRAQTTNGTENGVYTWAKLGFDGEIDDDDRKLLPPSLSGAQTIQELLAMPGGAEFLKSGKIREFGGTYKVPEHATTAGRTESIQAVSLERMLMERGYTGTLTDKAGHKITYQDGKRVAGQHDQGGDKGHASHAADVEQSVKADIENLPPEQQAKAKGLIAKVGDKVNQFIIDHATAFGRLATAASAIEALITTPEDIAKSPWLASKFDGSKTAGDHIADATQNELGIGIPGTVVTKLVAAAMAHAWKKVKQQIGLSESTGVDYDAAGEFIAGLLDAIHEGLGLPTGADAKAIAEQLKGLTPPAAAPERKESVEEKQPINVSVNIVEAATPEPKKPKKTKKTAKKMPDGTWIITEE